MAAAAHHNPIQPTNYHGKYTRSSHYIPNHARPPFRVEKYRPQVLEDIVGNSETVERLKIIAKDGNMPHVIISGMPGIGYAPSPCLVSPSEASGLIAMVLLGKPRRSYASRARCSGMPTKRQSWN